MSLTIHNGEILGLVGESGSGKSVTAMTIMGLISMPPGKIEGGSVTYRGHDLLSMSEEEMQHVRGNDIAMIFQEPMTSLNPVLKVGMQTAEPLRLHLGMSRSDARQEVIRLFSEVGIPAAESRYDDYPHQLSGGMRQRVMIAMALACKPDLLLADEPTTALDVTIQAQILALLKRLNQEMGMSILFISHNLHVVRKLCTRVAVMEKGRIVETGPVDQIFFHPQAPYTQRLIAAIPTRRKL